MRRLRSTGIAVAIAFAIAIALALPPACASPDTEVVLPPPTIAPVACGAEAATDDELPTIPVGFDAYRAWDRWPIVRIGARTYMRSTYDRTGGNEGADASHFLRQAGDELVALDVAGPGELWFVRTNRWHGSPWRYLTDGVATIVEESSTSDPDHPVTGSTFLPASLFPPPFALTWSETRGADLSWVPIPYAHGLELRYGRSHYATGYFIHSTFAEGATNLSQAPCTWERRPPPSDVAALLGRTAEELAPDVGNEQRRGVVDVPADGRVLVDRIGGAPGMLRAITFDVAAADAEAFGRAVVEITWDDRAAPSVLAPVALFFGAGTLYNRDGREHLVRSFPTTIRFSDGRARLTAVFPMPFARSASIALVGGGAPVRGARWESRIEPRIGSPPPANAVGYFHATYHDFPTPTPGKDNVLLDTTHEEGGGEWCGTFIGTSFVFSRDAVLTTLEGDPRFYFDDSLTPQGHGTGTEEWGGGGDYWGGQTMTLPLAGHPVGAPSAAAAKSAEDRIESAYRWLLADAMPFGRNARIQLEHGGTDESREHYSSVAYWYGLPGACLVPTDTLDVGDGADEARHAWSASGASEPTPVRARYDNGLEGDPTFSRVGRTIERRASFRLTIAADNQGVLLRRSFDYGLADQRAEVFVADDRDDAPFVHAGTWYAAGSSTALYAFAPTETGTVTPEPRPTDRRLRDDELLIAKPLTRGRSAIRVRIDVVAPARWNAIRYAAYAWRMPPAP